MAELKDSGARKEFETGAVRDISEGKGRTDLLPLYEVGGLLDAPELVCIEAFKRTKDPDDLARALSIFIKKTYTDIYTAMIEVSKHYEDGARKYSENNWKRGMPLHCFIDSGVRHFLEHSRGDTDEPHARAFMWNLLGAMWTINNLPEMDDIETDIRPEFLSKNLVLPKNIDELKYQHSTNPEDVIGTVVQPSAFDEVTVTTSPDGAIHVDCVPKQAFSDSAQLGEFLAKVTKNLYD